MKLMNLEITRIAHDTFKVVGSKVIYTDPYKVTKTDEADIVLISHEHFDHLSLDDLKKVIFPGSTILASPLCKDGLKGVNDRDGHAAGDRVLRTLAATMRANLRSYDPIVRYGGDEFVCGVASIDPSEVQHRIGVIDQSLRHATGVGITAGLASMIGNETLEELTERADAALLDAKRSRHE